MDCSSQGTLAIGLSVTLLAVVWVFWYIHRTSERLAYERVLREINRKNLAWYRLHHPGSVHRDGTVACYCCDSTKLHVAQLMHYEYRLEHFCPNCHTKLYYSKA